MTDSPPEIQFPLALSLRVMGRNTSEFPQLVVDLLRPHAPELNPKAIVSHLSRDGRFISLLIPLTLATRAQFDAVYQELADNDQVLTVL